MWSEFVGGLSASRGMNIKTLEMHLESKFIITEKYDFLLLLKHSGASATPSAVNFDLFLKLFSRLLMYMAITNMISLLLQMKIHSTYMSLPLRIMSYQRNLYFHGIKHYNELSKEDTAIINSIQDLQKIEGTKQEYSRKKEEELRRALIEGIEDVKERVSSSESSEEDENVQLLMRMPRRQLTVELMSAIAQDSPSNSSKSSVIRSGPSSYKKSSSPRSSYRLQEKYQGLALSLLKINK